MAKKISIYGILATLCLILGYVEHLVSLDFIAPGIKIGLANSVALLLLARGDIKGAFAVNITRILLSALLFAAPSTLIFSFSGGITSLIVMKQSYKSIIIGYTQALTDYYKSWTNFLREINDEDYELCDCDEDV